MSEQKADYITETQEALEMLGHGYGGDILPPSQFIPASSGFTPCPDILVKKYSHTTALIWGKVWRFCQMSEDVCRAAIQRIADELNLSQNTIYTHIKKLEEGGYIFDTTPDLRNKPHIYVDTGKLRLKISLFMAETGTQILSSDTSKIAHEETTTNNPYQIYEANMGPLTPMVADSIDDLVKTYSLGWFVDAVGLAVRRNARNLAYVEKILKRWQSDGKDDGKSKPAEAEKLSEYTTL